MLEGKRGLILINDASLRNRISKACSGFGVLVSGHHKKESFLKSLSKENPHFILIGKRDALQDQCGLVTKIRNHSTSGLIPIIVLGKMIDLENKSVLIQTGVDRVENKDVTAKALALEIYSLLRRAQSYHKDEETLDFGNIHINPNRQQVRVLGQDVKLTGIEFNVFFELLNKKGEIVSREKLSQRYLSLRNSSDRTLDVHINALRRKLGSLGKNLTTIRGRGYMFRS